MMSSTDVLERRLFVRRNKSIGGDLMISYTDDGEQMLWLGKGKHPSGAKRPCHRSPQETKDPDKSPTLKLSNMQ